MSGTNTRTLELEKLFVRDIYYKDPSNRPIPRDLVLLSRGDGGTYFGNPNIIPNLSTGFTSIQAGSNITIKASDTNNVLSLQPGAGIQFYQQGGDCGTGSPQLYIYATAPDQITVNGGGSGTLNFNDLTNDPCNGGVLYFAGVDDTTVNISDTTILIGSQYNSSLSTVQHLISTVEGIQDEQSTLNAYLISTISTVDLLLVSTGIAELYSTVQFTERIAISTSSFVFSTFAADAYGNHTILNVNQVNTTNVCAASTVFASLVTAYTMDIGSNALYDVNIPGDIPSQCIVITQNATVSTFTNYFNIKDEQTNVELAFEKQFIVGVSTSQNSTFQTFGEQIQIGFFPYLSTQGALLPNTLTNQYVPILQQIEVLEQVVTSSLTGGFTSTQTNYFIKNIIKADEICSGDNLLFTAPHITMTNLDVSSLHTSSLVANYIMGSTAYISSLSTPFIQGNTISISTLTVSSINGQIPGTGTGGGGSTFTGIYVDVIMPSTIGYPVTVSSINISSLNGLPYNVYSTLSVSSLTANSINTQALSSILAYFSTARGNELTLNSLSVGNVQTPSISTTNISSQTIGFGLIQGPNISTTNISSQTIGFGLIQGPSISTTNISSQTIGFGLIQGPSISTTNISSQTIGFGLIQGPSISTTNISSQTVAFNLAKGPSISTTNISSQTVAFDLAKGPSISTTNISSQNIGFNLIQGPHISTTNISSQTIGFGLIQGPSISTTNISSQTVAFDLATGPSISTTNISSQNIGFNLIQGPHISTTNISTYNIGYDTAKGRILNNDDSYFSTVHFSTMVGWDAQMSSLEVSTITAYRINVIYISSFNISTFDGNFCNLNFQTGTGSTLTTKEIFTSSIQFDYGIGGLLSTAEIFTSSIQFDKGIGSSLQTSTLYFDTGYGSTLFLSTLFVSTMTAGEIFTSSIYFNAGIGSSIQLSTVMGYTLPIFTFDLSNQRVGVNLGANLQPRATMDISGIVFATNFVTPSDRRLKKNISELDTPHLIPRAYRYSALGSDEPDIGVMADEIELIAPECIYMRPDGYKAVSYQKLVPICFSLIRSLSERLAAVESRL